MDNNLLTLFSGILTIAGTLLSALLGQLAKKHSNVKNLETLTTLATQAVAWAEKNFNENPEKLKGAIDYVTKEAQSLKVKFAPAQIEAQIEASYAEFKKNLKTNPLQAIAGVIDTATDNVKTVSDTVAKVAENPVTKEIEQAVPEVTPVVETVQNVVETIETNAEQLNALVQPIINGTEGFVSE